MEKSKEISNKISLLVTTQKLDKNDDVLGFFHGWVLELAKHCRQLTVICLEKGEYELPANVKVLSLGKEAGISRFKYVRRFFKYIWRQRKNYDTVFVHMNPEYVVLGGLLWRALGKKINLWYAHRQVNFKLRLAALLAHQIFTASEKSFNLKSKKAKIIGHGIDTGKFVCRASARRPDRVSVVSVGRITRIKNLATLIKALKICQRNIGKKIKLEIIGGPVTSDDNEYYQELKHLIAKDNLGSVVAFAGPKPYPAMADLYCRHDIFVNLAPTGGIDKAALEAMSCGLPVLVANQAFAPYFGQWANQLIFKLNDAQDLAEKISVLANNQDKTLGDYLRQQAIVNFSQDKLIKKIISNL